MKNIGKNKIEKCFISSSYEVQGKYINVFSLPCHENVKYLSKMIVSN